MLDRRLFLASAAALAATACSRAAAPGEQPSAPPEETAAEAFEAIRATLGPGARLGVAAIETGSGRRLVHDADSLYAMASTFKLPLAAFALAQAEAGRVSLDEALPFGSDDPLPHSPVVLRHLGEGGLSVIRLCSAVVERSDNSAANMLLRRLGGPEAFTRFVRACGDPVTRLDRYETALNANLPGDPRDTTSAAAMAGLVRALLTGGILAPQSRSHLSTWLKKAVPGPDRLPAGLPDAWLVGHKTGTGANGAANDVAIAWRSGAAPIVIASYQDGGDADLAARAAAHAAIARLVAGRLGVRRRAAARPAALAAAFLLAGCVSLPAPRSIACDAAPRPEIRLSADGAVASTELDVLTYNIEGLPKFTRKARRDSLEEIGAYLAALRAAGEAPDVVLFQEVFSRRARAGVLAAGYPSLAPGPSAGQYQASAASPRLPGRSNPRKGELGLKFASSGLVIAAEYPLIDMEAVPFRRGSCAGMDCLANKGIAFARMAIPGLPVPVDLYTTHMNSTAASRVAERRHLAAHNKQAREIGDYVGLNSPPSLPVVFGGDFNMRGQPDRFEQFIRLHRLRLVHVYCTRFPSTCDVRQSWDGDEPWLDTQDLQLFSSGSALTIRPIRVEAMFDGSEGSPKLSDHDAFRVVYELTLLAAAGGGAGRTCPTGDLEA